MQKKYIFLDIDGTLVGKDGDVPLSARKAIREARQNGHKVFIATGRSRCQIPEYLVAVGLDGIVASAGAYVELDGKMIWHRPMTERMNMELLSYLNDKQMEIMVETNDKLLVNAGGRKTSYAYIRECKENHIPYNKAFYDLIEPLEGIENPAKLAINKILYVNSPYDNAMIRQDLAERYTVVECSLELTGNSGEISEKGMHKGKGIGMVIEYLGADMEDTIAIGDGENDMEMLQAAYVGIAMGNANPQLKKIADYVTTDVQEDGLKNAFVQYHLI